MPRFYAAEINNSHAAATRFDVRLAGFQWPDYGTGTDDEIWCLYDDLSGYATSSDFYATSCPDFAQACVLLRRHGLGATVSRAVALRTVMKAEELLRKVYGPLNTKP